MQGCCNGAYGGVLSKGHVKLGVVDVAVAVLGTARKGAVLATKAAETHEAKTSV